MPYQYLFIINYPQILLWMSISYCYFYLSMHFAPLLATYHLISCDLPAWHLSSVTELLLKKNLSINRFFLLSYLKCSFMCIFAPMITSTSKIPFTAELTVAWHNFLIWSNYLHMARKAVYVLFISKNKHTPVRMIWWIQFW